jgi:hypothetical protein
MTNQSVSTSINTATSKGWIVLKCWQCWNSAWSKHSSEVLLRSNVRSQFSTRTFRVQTNLQPEGVFPYAIRAPSPCSMSVAHLENGSRLLTLRKYFAMKCQKKTATNTRLDKDNIPYFIRQGVLLWCCVSLRHAYPCWSFRTNDGF